MKMTKSEKKAIQSNSDTLKERKNWITPDIEIISVEAGTISVGNEGSKTLDFPTFGHQYHS
jgi:hypothetical protein